MKVSTSTVAALFSKNGLDRPESRYGRYGFACFSSIFHIYCRVGWSQSFPLKIILSCSLAGGGRYFSVPCSARLPNKGPSHAKNTTPKNLSIQGEIIYAPPPPLISGQKAFFRGGGWGCIIRSPARQDFIPSPILYTAPTPRRVFSVGGGGGV